MNHYFDQTEKNAATPGRESFSGRPLTDRLFYESTAIIHIIKNEISSSGTFVEKLGDYSHAFARTAHFDTKRAETILRDLFKETFGQTMNQMREELVKRQENVTDQSRQSAYDHATAIGDLMQESVKMSFNRAVAHQAQHLGQELDVTDAFARGLMAEEFEAAEGQTLWEWGKELDERFYRPQIEAEKQERSQSRSNEREPRGRSATRTTQRSRPRP